MSLAGRVTAAIALATISSIVVVAVLVRGVLGAYLAPFADHFAMMQRMMGSGPDLQTIHGLVDRALLLAVIVAILLASLAGLLLGRELAQSVAVLQRGFKRFSEGRLQERITLSGPAELESIAASANRMAEELRVAQLAERELVAGIAHDLAHPLTAMRGTLEGARDGLADLSEPAVMARLLAGVGALDEALGDLRDVAAAEVGGLRVHIGNVDLGGLVERTTGMYLDLARRKGIALETQRALGVTVRGDEQRLARVLANLVMNALQATPPGGRVDVETFVDSTEAVLRVEDTAGPDAATHIGVALERGVQAGLGLRVVRLVGRALGAAIRVRQGSHGAIVEVGLPRS